MRLCRFLRWTHPVRAKSIETDCHTLDGDDPANELIDLEIAFNDPELAIRCHQHETAGPMIKQARNSNSTGVHRVPNAGASVQNSSVATDC